MSKKRIAILIEWYLPGTKAGGPVRSVYSLVNLLRDYFDFYIITTNRDLGSDRSYTDIESDQWTKYNGVNVFYFSNSSLNKNSLKKTVNEIDPDFIYLNSFWSYWFSIAPLQLKKKDLVKGNVVLAPRGMLSKGALSLKAFKKKSFLFFSKLSGLHSQVRFHATTVTEQSEIKQFFPRSEIKIASNVNAAIPVRNKGSRKEKGKLRMFYLSRVAEVKNLHFALEVLKNINKGDVAYDIFGSLEDKAYWQKCESIIRELPSNIKVSYKGELGFESVQQTIKEYDFLFLPTLNENFGHSIVESLASACPVIISDRTPWTDVHNDGCGYSISLDDFKKFTEAISSALQMDKVTHSQMCENCITFIEKKINLDQQKEAYKDLFS